MKQYYSKKITKNNNLEDSEFNVQIDKNGNIKFKNIKQNIKNKQGRTKSSNRWLTQHVNDPFVMASQMDGFLSRAAYKLIEIDTKYKILKQNKPNEAILDLGCAPGSWTQVLLRKITKNTIVGIDILEISTISEIYQANNFHFIQGDFEDETTINKILSITNNQKINLILSDMAINSVGDAETDRLCSERLMANVFNFCKKKLACGGNMVFKALQGSDNGEIIKEMKKYFKKIDRFKPKSSRKNSSEIFIIAQNFQEILT